MVGVILRVLSFTSFPNWIYVTEMYEDMAQRAWTVDKQNLTNRSVDKWNLHFSSWIPDYVTSLEGKANSFIYDFYLPLFSYTKQRTDGFFLWESNI